MEPLGVHHVSVNVDDVDAAVQFYTDVLGFTRRDDRPDFGFGDLRAAGVSVSDAAPVGIARQAFVSDPSGSVVELHQTA